MDRNRTAGIILICSALAAAAGIAQISGPMFPGPGMTAAGPVQPVTGMDIWYSADCMINTGCTSQPSNGASVTTWADRSGNANNLSKTAGTCTFNTGQINSQPAVDFAGTCTWAFGSAITAKAAHAVFVVYKLSSTAGQSYLISGTAGAFGYWFSGGAGPKMQGGDSTGIAQLGTGTAVADTSWHQANINFTNGTSANFAFHLDRTNDTVIVGTTASPGVADTVIGKNAVGGGSIWTGQIAEIISYTSNTHVLTPTEVTQNETYLFNKYGL